MNRHYLNPVTRIAKRIFDIVVCLILLLLSCPLWPLIGLAIKLNSKGPIFFKQLRIGQANQQYVALFYLYKFRSMVVDAEANGRPQWASKGDPRITPIGQFLRKTRLDELPQLLNVLRGEMSLIGPRPERPGFYQTLERAIPFYAERTVGLLPGITGFAQVMQGYDETLEDVRQKLLFDHAYALSLSHPWHWLKMDCFILCKTVVTVICGRGQ